MAQKYWKALSTPTGRLRRTLLTVVVGAPLLAIVTLASVTIDSNVAEATPSPTVVNLSYTGSAQTWTVPANVIGAITFTVIGGSGGNSYNVSGGYGGGGSGGEATGQITAAAGSTFNVYVGSGGANATAAAGSSSCPYYGYGLGGNGGTSALPSGLGSGGGGGWSGNMIQSYVGNSCWEQYDDGSGAGGGGALSSVTSSACSSGVSISGVSSPTCFIAGGGGGGGGANFNSVPTGADSQTADPSPTTSCTTLETGPFNVLFEFNWYFECLGGNGGAAESSASGAESPGSNPIATWNNDGVISSGTNSSYSQASGNLSYNEVPQGYGAGGGGGGGGYGPGGAGTDESAAAGADVAGGGGGAGGGSYVDATNVSSSSQSSSGSSSGANGSVQISYIQGIAPSITSGASTTSTTSTAFGFTMLTTGYPSAALTTTGTLPAGVTFTNNGDGTGTLSGTPSSSAGGLYNFTVTATNTVGIATQNFTLTVNQPALIASTSSTNVDEGSALSFAMAATGYPLPTFSEVGALPTGITLSSAGLLSGTPTETGSFSFTVTATNGVGTAANQSFTLAVNAAPAFTSADNAAITVGEASSFTVRTTGYPTPAFTVATGALPSGLTLNDNGDGTATISGTASHTGSYSAVLSATNSIGFALQSFTLTVDEAASFTSAATIDLAAGTAFSYSITTTGAYPTPALTVTGTLPAGMTFTDNANGTATLAGTVATSAEGNYTPTFVASSSGTAVVDDLVSLVIEGPDATITCPTGDTCGGSAPQAPTFTSASSTTFTSGSAASFAVTATGSPNPTFSEVGSLPSGVTFSSSGTLSGTPTATGQFPLSVTATNGELPNATQTFTLTVNAAPSTGSGGGSGGGGSGSGGGAPPPVTTTTTTTTTLPVPPATTPTTLPSPPVTTPTTLPSPPASTPTSGVVSSYAVTAVFAGMLDQKVACSVPPSKVHESANKKGALTTLGFSVSCTDGADVAALSGSITSTTSVVRHKSADGKMTTTHKVVWHGGFQFAEPAQHLVLTLLPSAVSVNRDLVLKSTSVATVTVDHKKRQIRFSLTIAPNFASST